MTGTLSKEAGYIKRTTWSVMITSRQMPLIYDPLLIDRQSEWNEIQIFHSDQDNIKFVWRARREQLLKFPCYERYVVQPGF
jgi:hypothetical protein